jgi:hypothetical protein
MIEGYSVADAYGQYYQDAKANRTKTTYGAFVGLEDIVNRRIGKRTVGYGATETGAERLELNVAELILLLEGITPLRQHRRYRRPAVVPA